MTLKPTEIGRTDTFRDQYRGLSDPIKRKVKRKLAILGDDIFNRNLRTERVKSDRRFWKCKIDDDYECVFKLEGARVTLCFVVDHKTFDRMF